jgi:hypothetical protein
MEEKGEGVGGVNVMRGGREGTENEGGSMGGWLGGEQIKINKVRGRGRDKNKIQVSTLE